MRRGGRRYGDGVLAVVDSVELVPRMSFTVAAASAADVVLVIDDMADFRERGGQALVGEDVVDYAAAISDEESDRLTIPAGLPAHVGNRAPVYPYPVRRRKVVRVLSVDDLAGDSFPAYVVDPQLWADQRLTEGSTGGLTVQISKVGAFWYVDAIIGGEPILDGSVLAPGTVTPETFGDGTTSAAILFHGPIQLGAPGPSPPTLVAEPGLLTLPGLTAVPGIIQDAIDAGDASAGIPEWIDGGTL